MPRSPVVPTVNSSGAPDAAHGEARGTGQGGKGLMGQGAGAERVTREGLPVHLKGNKSNKYSTVNYVMIPARKGQGRVRVRGFLRGCAGVGAPAEAILGCQLSNGRSRKLTLFPSQGSWKTTTCTVYLFVLRNSITAEIFFPSVKDLNNPHLCEKLPNVEANITSLLYKIQS